MRAKVLLRVMESQYGGAAPDIDTNGRVCSREEFQAGRDDPAEATFDNRRWMPKRCSSVSDVHVHDSKEGLLELLEFPLTFMFFFGAVIQRLF